MLGLSTYLSASKEQQDKTISMLNKGDYCFLSLHHPNDLVDGFKNNAFDLINRVSSTGAKIVADIAPVGIKMLDFKSLKDLAKTNLVWGLRPDYGLNATEIAAASDYTNIVINASCIDKKLVHVLENKKIKYYAMHNFYPRPETGLTIEYCNKCSDYLRSHGAEVWAFVAGDEHMRGTIFEGLPTIEQYRKYPTYIQYCLLKYKNNIDTVFVGDVSIKDSTRNLIYATEKDDVIRIPACIEQYDNKLYNKVFTIRADGNDIVARLQESRNYANSGEKVIELNNNQRRMSGSITMDNHLYSVYSGEVQICLKDLQPDKRVNLIGHIYEKYSAILNVCEPGRRIMFINEEDVYG